MGLGGGGDIKHSYWLSESVGLSLTDNIIIVIEITSPHVK